jgi:hypothetical protein
MLGKLAHPAASMAYTCHFQYSQHLDFSLCLNSTVLSLHIVWRSTT